MMSRGTLWWNNVTDVFESRRRELGGLTDPNESHTCAIKCEVGLIELKRQFLMQFFTF